MRWIWERVESNRKRRLVALAEMEERKHRMCSSRSLRRASAIAGVVGKAAQASRTTPTTNSFSCICPSFCPFSVDIAVGAVAIFSRFSNLK